MRRRKSLAGKMVGALVLGALLLAAAMAPTAQAEVRLKVDSLSNTTTRPGDILDYRIQVKNFGDEATTEPFVLTVQLPPGLTVTDPSGPISDPQNPHNPGISEGLQRNLHMFAEGAYYSCTEIDGSPLVGGESELKCEDPEPMAAKKFALAWLSVNVSPAAVPGTILTTHFQATGGGSPDASAIDPTRVSAEPPAFGLDAFEGYVRNADGTPYTRAGGHNAFAIGNQIEINTHLERGAFTGPDFPVEPLKDAIVDLPPGLVGNPSAVGHCTGAQLNLFQSGGADCPTDAQVGTVTLQNVGVVGFLPDTDGPLPLYEMIPPPGVAARFGFNFQGTSVLIDAVLGTGPNPGLVVKSRNISEALALAGAQVELWGVPYSPVHDPDRACPREQPPSRNNGAVCKVSASTIKPFLRMPTSCEAPGEGMPWRIQADSWYHRGAFDYEGFPVESDPAWHSLSALSHQAPSLPHLPSEWGAPVGVGECGDVPVKGKLNARPTVLEAETSSGLDVHVEVPNPGLDNPTGVASSDIKDVKIALPQGMSINPSQAEGLGVCSEGQYASTRLEFHPDGAHGCPSNSKIGTVSVVTPLLEETIPGEVYVATPYENPSGSLLALYIVLEEPQRGVLIKLPVKLTLNEETGRIEAEVEEAPQMPFDSFDFHFREGARAPLVTPATCGTYTTETKIEGWSDPGHPIQSNSSFQITKGIGGGPCPTNGTPAFKPLFSAGAVNNNAASFSPFNMRIQRADGEQDMTRFSAVLPPGVLGKLAGVSKCPDSAIAVAKAHNGPHGGQEEIDHPSCPANSQIGRSTVGAGVGSVLTYVPGKVYLGGPFHGDPLSIIAITPAVAGPFDIGTVVVHEALTLNPKTAEVEVDGSASDPIPNILKGIPAKLRDLRIYVDRPDFTLNPTSCEPSATHATLFGGGGNPFSTLDDIPVALTDRFQAASCASLGFKPKLALKLKGGTKRGGHPGLTAIYTPKKGNANIKGLTVRLPRSAFLDQAHIKTICTRVQFAAKNCPKAARYGYIKAWTPLLEEPLEGPVYLRSSNHKLPDLVFDLHGLVDVEVATRIDSVKGGIRATVEDAPDAPLSKVLLRMQGAKKGLIINSRNLCGAPSRAKVDFVGQNGKEASASPVMKADCGGKRKHKRPR